MAITLATVSTASFWTQPVVLAMVGIGITAEVYGGVALIVKADDTGVPLASNDRPVSNLFADGRRGSGPSSPSRADRLVGVLTQGFERGLVQGMPVFSKVLCFIREVMRPLAGDRCPAGGGGRCRRRCPQRKG